MDIKKSVVQLESGLRLSVSEIGKGSQTILALHQVTGFGLMWESVAHHLASDYRVIMPDMRGHGDSEKPSEGYSALDYEDDIIRLADQLECNRFAILSHSLGTRVGIRLAADYPDRMSHLIAVGGVHRWSFPADEKDAANNAEELREKRTHIESRDMRNFTKEEAEKYLRRLKPSLTGSVVKHLLQYNLSKQGNGLFDWKWSLSAISSTLDATAEDLSRLATRITCPVLMLLTDAESKVLSEEAAPHIRQCFETGEWKVIPGKWDYVYMEAPQLVAQETREFLKRTSHR